MMVEHLILAHLPSDAVAAKKIGTAADDFGWCKNI